MKNIALVIAGGVGARTHQDIPKQFIFVNDVPVIIHTLRIFQDHPQIDAIEVVCLVGWIDSLWLWSKQFGINKLENIVNGGDHGQDSIRNGLLDLHERYHDVDDIVIIHDSNRPMVSADIISENIRVCREKGNAITAVPCTAALLKTNDSFSSAEQVPRNDIRITQTPQSFFLSDILEAHQEALNRGITNSVASCTMYVELGQKVYLSKGSEKNIKLTTMEDLEIFKALLDADKDIYSIEDQ
jgi:2-C-methyl-D-erythritol 4-phosphate cytidylyltransferase